MKAEFLIENIEKYLPILSKVLPLHSQIPVLSNLLIETNKEGIFFYATNLEIGIRVKIPGKVDEEGGVTVPGKQFLETISSLPKDKVGIAKEGENLVLKCRDNMVSFQTIAREEFPAILEHKGDKLQYFSEEEMKEIFTSLIFAASPDDGRPELTGVLFSQKEEGLDFVATDGFRLSLKKLSGIKMGEEEELILPSRLISEAISQKSAFSVYVYRKANQVVFESGDVTLVGRMITGVFPKYEKVVPKEGKTKITLDVEDLLQKLKLVSVFARDSANIVKTKIAAGSVHMQARSAGVGEGEITISGEQEGEDNEIAFNIKFLTDLLKNITAKEVTIEVSSPIEPALFRVDNDPNFIHVIMPVRVQD